MNYVELPELVPGAQAKRKRAAGERRRLSSREQLRNAYLDAGLQRLSDRAVRGVPFTYEEMSKECGVSRQWLRILERRALRKVCERLKDKMGVDWGEFFTAGGMYDH